MAASASVATSARMSDAAKAQCYSLRYPSKSGEKAMSYPDIAKVVYKTDKTHPNPEAVRQAVENFGQDTALHRKLAHFVLKPFPQSRAPARRGPKAQSVHFAIPLIWVLEGSTD